MHLHTRTCTDTLSLFLRTIHFSLTAYDRLRFTTRQSQRVQGRVSGHSLETATTKTDNSRRSRKNHPGNRPGTGTRLRSRARRLALPSSRPAKVLSLNYKLDVIRERAKNEQDVQNCNILLSDRGLADPFETRTTGTSPPRASLFNAWAERMHLEKNQGREPVSVMLSTNWCDPENVTIPREPRSRSNQPGRRTMKRNHRILQDWIYKKP